MNVTRVKRHELGLCPTCGAARDDGRIHCSACRASIKAKREDYLARGLCGNGGCCLPARPGFTTCQKCTDLNRRNSKRRYDALIAAGKCLDCSKAVSGSVYCAACATRRSQRKRAGRS